MVPLKILRQGMDRDVFYFKILGQGDLILPHVTQFILLSLTSFANVANHHLNFPAYP